MKLQGCRKFFFLVERHLNPGSFNPWFFNYELFNPGLSEHEFWNHGVEKSGPNPKIFENKYWELAVLKISVFLSWPFWFFFFQKKIFLASFPWKQVKVYWLARMGQNFDQAKSDDSFWPRPNILHPSVSFDDFLRSYACSSLQHLGSSRLEGC